MLAGERFGGEAFDRGQADHLAADLGEALGAAADGDEAFIVDRDDVAGVVPAAFRRLKHAGLFERR